MTSAIIIGSYIGSPWLSECLLSLPKNIPVIVVCEPLYECGKIGWVYRNTTLDEFLFLPDTTIVRRHEWIYDVLRSEGESVSVNAEPGAFGSFMGKYRRTILDAIGGVPNTPDKMSAVLAEMDFTKRYCTAETNLRILFPELAVGINSRFEARHGRLNVVLENEHLVKYKGAWNGDMIEPCEARDRILSGR